MGSKKRKIIKKPIADEHMEESNSSDNSFSETNLPEEIQATFEGRNLEEFDFHGVKQLLKQCFLKAHIDISQLTDMLINQYGIGSVLKQVSDDGTETDDMEDDDSNEVFGVTSVLNISENRETPCIQEMFSFFKEQLRKYGQKDTQDKFNDVINKNEKIALLINERFVNIPAAVSAPMFSSLQEEIKQAKKKKSSYDFQYYIMVCKTYRPKGDKGETSFCNDEECIFSTHADCSFEYSVEKESDTAIAGKWSSTEEEVIPFRKVLLFPANKLENIISQIINFVQT